MFLLFIIFLVPIGFIIYGFYKTIKKNKDCTEPAEATIISFDEREHEDDKGYIHKSKSPVITYKVKFKTIKARNKSITKGIFFNRFDIGDTIEIKYNPKKPKEFIISAQQKRNLIWLIFLSLFILGWIVLGIVTSIH